jgi:Na+(H+)/acetate symporter ActP
MKFQYGHKEIRKWAVLMAIILVVIGAVQLYLLRHQNTATVLWLIAIVFLVDGLLFPSLLKPVYWLWMKFAGALAWINTRLIMVLVFYLIFTPVGIILRILGVDLIKQRWDEKKQSYWIDRPDEPFDPNRYEKQY